MGKSRISLCVLGALVCAVAGVGLLPDLASARCGGNSPPPPPPPPQPDSGVDPLDGDQGFTPPGTLPPGQTGGPTGPDTPGGGGGGIGTGGRRNKSAGGVDAGHWTHWWYANRVFLLEQGVRVRTHAGPRTGSDDGKPVDTLWRADARRALALALSADDDEVVAAAVLALGKAGDAADIPIVSRLLLDTKRGVPEREHAAMALGLLPADTPADAADARMALQTVAQENGAPERLKALAVYALGLRQDEAAMPFLVDCARGGARTWDVPAASLTALGLSGCDHARDELERVLVDAKGKTEKMRRVYAAHGLAKLADPAALPALYRVLGDKQADVRRATVLAIGAVAPRGDAEAVKRLRRVLVKDRDRGAQGMAAVSLGLIGGDDAVAALQHCYERGDGTVRPFAAVALGVVARRSEQPKIAAVLLRDLKKGTRHQLLGATCVAVGLAGLKEAAPQLREIIETSRSPLVLAQAAVSLGLIGDREDGRELLRGLLETSNDQMVRGEAALGLGMLGDVRTLPVLAQMVASGSVEHVRLTGCVALGRIGGADAAKVLTATLQDEKRSDLERHVAGNALGTLLDRSDGRRVGRVGADLNWYALTPTVFDILSEM